MDENPTLKTRLLKRSFRVGLWFLVFGVAPIAIRAGQGDIAGVTGQFTALAVLAFIVALIWEGYFNRSRTKSSRSNVVSESEK